METVPETRTLGETIVQCRGLTKVFHDFWMRGRVRAVDAIDLDVHRGEIFGLLGPNGSGKSTTIKLALGLLHPTHGTVAVFGQRPSSVAAKRKIGYLPEESYLYRFLNARETLDYYGRLFYQNRTQRRQRIDMLLDMVGLASVQRRPVGEYSKGMQRRIGLAQALINDPDLLVLDEPTTGLDPIGTRQVKDLIHELSRRGKTVILCSHLLADVEDVCDRVAIMFGGKIHKEGTIDALLTRAGTTAIQTDDLDAATIAKVEKVLEANGHHITSLDRPRQHLDSLFLDIVHEALEHGDPTSGARGDGPLARFLVSEEGDAQDRGEDVINALMDDGAPITPPLPATGGPTSPKANVAAIDALVKPASPPTAGSSPRPSTTEAEAPAPEASLINDLMRDDDAGEDQDKTRTPNPPRSDH